MTTELRFRSVHIPGFGAVFWLPSEVLISTTQSDSLIEELHQYSGYRFFHAESRLPPDLFLSLLQGAFVAAGTVTQANLQGVASKGDGKTLWFEGYGLLAVAR